MWKTLQKVKQNLLLSVLFALIAGLTTGYFFDTSPLKSLILPITILMVYPMMVPLKISQLFNSCDRKLLSMTQLLNVLIIPIIAIGIGKLFFAENSTFQFSLLLIALLPTSGMTISWTGLAKGDVPSAVRLTLAGLLGGSLLVPLYTQLFTFNTSVPIWGMIQRVLFVLLIPLIAGQVTRKLIVKQMGEVEFNQKIKVRFPLISTLAVLLMIFAAISLKAKIILNNPMLILTLFVPIVLFYLLTYTIAGLTLFRTVTKEKAIAGLFGSAMRNLSIALALAVTAMKENAGEAALIISLAFVVQIQSASFVTKLLKRRNATQHSVA